MDNPRNFMEALDIDMPEEQAGKAMMVAAKFMSDKSKVFQSMTTSYLMETNPMVIQIVNSLPPLQEGFAQLLRLYYQLGYIKGILSGESKATTDKLDKLWKE